LIRLSSLRGLRHDFLYEVIAFFLDTLADLVAPEAFDLGLVLGELVSQASIL